MVMQPRLALFAESFHEVNGVALTCREFFAYAKRRGVPFLCVAPGREPVEIADGSTMRLEVPPHKLSFAIDADMRFDLAFPLHLPGSEPPWSDSVLTLCTSPVLATSGFWARFWPTSVAFRWWRPGIPTSTNSAPAV